MTMARRWILCLALTLMMTLLIAADDAGSRCAARPSPAGPCRARMTRYRFMGGKCQKFIYGGCEGTINNFHTLEACKNGTGFHMQISLGHFATPILQIAKRRGTWTGAIPAATKWGRCPAMTPNWKSGLTTSRPANRNAESLSFAPKMTFGARQCSCPRRNAKKVITKIR